MFVNLTKTSSMSIGSRQNLSNSDDFFITIDDDDISNVENQKLLGISIDKTLSLDKQIDSVCLNISRRITLLKLLSTYVDMPNQKLYYNSYILPIFDYGCMIWGQCSAYNINRLLKLPRWSRIVFLPGVRSSSSELDRVNPGSAGSEFGVRNGSRLVRQVWSLEKGPGQTLVQQVRSSEKGTGPASISFFKRSNSKSFQECWTR